MTEKAPIVCGAVSFLLFAIGCCALAGHDPEWTVVAKETFDAYTNRYADTEHNDPGFTVSVADGVGRIAGVSTDDKWMTDGWVLPIATDTNDLLELSADFMIPENDGYLLVFLSARSDSPTNALVSPCMYFDRRQGRRGTYRIQIARMKCPHQLVGGIWRHRGFGDEPTTLHNMRMIVDRAAPEITYFADDEKIGTVKFDSTAAPFSSVTVGVQTPDTNRTLNVRVDNLLVRSAAKPKGWAPSSIKRDAPLAPKPPDLQIYVRDCTPRVSEEDFAELDRAFASGVDEEAEAALMKMLANGPATNATVLLQGYAFSVPVGSFAEDIGRWRRGDSHGKRIAHLRALWTDWDGSEAIAALKGRWVEYEGVTDAEGICTLHEAWASGLYEVSARSSSPPATSRSGSIAIGRKRLLLVSGCGSEKLLEINANSIGIKGRITDLEGRPVAGARVVGSPVPFRDCGDEYRQLKGEYEHQTATLSLEDGSYELHGFTPPNLYRIAGYLSGRDPSEGGQNTSSFFVDVHVESKGFVQQNENVLRVPLLCEGLLAPARKLRDVFIKHSPHISEEERSRFQERQLPSVDGDTITNVDIVLHRIDVENGNGAR